MKQIKVEEIELLYLTSDDLLLLSSNQIFLNNAQIEIEDLSYRLKPELFNQDDVRPIVVILPFKANFGNLNYFYWNNKPNLKELDLKVTQNNFTENDFEASVITRYQKTRCSNCGCWWDTLVVDEWNYFRTPGLGTAKIRQSKFKECPNCGESLRQCVVMIF
ncbi:hypothetical protein [Oscillatoria salina]|uniref:hypothetical protein n=1 Tax=Oscillatoria salina TaxID=331517 RepID=UPI0013BBF61F|nr:hypothetical protein [Oscillatoria salina]MBZ8182750.1 hypothetical protein [Oscillatoria salina IIICB1]NET91442.1 hypothetical protein [Kamptonema sp. SIO1D9]